jgi:crotonobetainyl-CoA:carnitine CoA-transferase CaiB-like acyl-CoA transferase
VSGPLEGVRVLEFTQIIAGPFGCQHIADMGADVVKVEPPIGEPWRLYAQFVPLESKTYQALNRGKRSLAIDLASTDGQHVIHRMVERMDVVVINYRPDVAARLHIDYDTLRAIRPDLIYVDSTAFGRRGPWANKPGYDIVAQGVSGLTASGARFDERGVPMLPSIGVPTADITTGYAIAMGVCAALFYRSQTGKGQLVQTSLLANSLASQGGSFMSLPPADGGLRTPFLAFLDDAHTRGAGYTEIVERRRALQQGRMSGNIYYRNYLTKDGAIAVGCLSASLRSKMRAALGIEGDPRDDDPHYDPTAPDTIAWGEALIERVETMFLERTSGEWVAHLEAAGVPAGEILFTEELDRHEQILANDYVIALDHDITGPQTMVAPVLQMSESPPRPERASPPLGAHSDEVLREAGIADEEIARLRAAGTIR